MPSATTTGGGPNAHVSDEQQKTPYGLLLWRYAVTPSRKSRTAGAAEGMKSSRVEDIMDLLHVRLNVSNTRIGLIGADLVSGYAIV